MPYITKWYIVSDIQCMEVEIWEYILHGKINYKFYRSRFQKGRAQAGKHPSSVSPVSKSFRLKYFSKNSIFWTISFSCLWNISYWAALGFSTTLPAQAHHYKPASLFHQTWPENRRRPFTFDSRYLLCLNTLKNFGMDSLVEYFCRCAFCRSFYHCLRHSNHMFANSTILIFCFPSDVSWCWERGIIQQIRKLPH